MILDKVIDVFRPKNRGLAAPVDPYRLAQVPWHHLAGVTITPDDAIGISAVWACCQVITNGICASRIDEFDDAEHTVKSKRSNVSYLMNTRINKEMPAIAGKESMSFGALTWGGGFGEIVPNEGNGVNEIWPFLPGTITPRRANGGEDLQIRKAVAGEMIYEYRPQFMSMGTQALVIYLPEERIFHLRGPSLTGYLGVNMVSLAVRTLAIALAQDKCVGSYFGNSTIVGGYLEHPGPGAMDEAAYNRLKQDINEKRTGPDQAHKIWLFEEGSKYHPIQADGQKAQLIESRKFSVEEICRFYGVPPHMVQHLEHATDNNVEHMGKQFVQGLMPWAQRWQQEMDYKFYSRRSQKYTKIQMGWLAEGDFKTRSEAKQIQRQNGVIDADEWRVSEGMPAIGGIEGTLRIVQANMATPKSVDEGTNVAAPKATGNDASPNNSARDGKNTSGVIARDAIVLLTSSAIDRYQRKIENRERDTKRGCTPEFKSAAKADLTNELSTPVGMITRLIGHNHHAWDVDMAINLGAETFVERLINEA